MILDFTRDVVSLELLEAVPNVIKCVMCRVVLFIVTVGIENSLKFYYL